MQDSRAARYFMFARRTKRSRDGEAASQGEWRRARGPGNSLQTELLQVVLETASPPSSRLQVTSSELHSRFLRTLPTPWHHKKTARSDKTLDPRVPEA